MRRPFLECSNISPSMHLGVVHWVDHWLTLWLSGVIRVLILLKIFNKLQELRKLLSKGYCLDSIANSYH